MTDYFFNIKKGDTHKPLAVQLKYKTSDGSDGVDLDGATVKFYMRLRDRRTLKIDGGSCDITNEGNGYVQYQWADADVDTEGIYEGEFVVIHAVTSYEETFPDTKNRIIIIIHEEM